MPSPDQGVTQSKPGYVKRNFGAMKARWIQP